MKYMIWGQVGSHLEKIKIGSFFNYLRDKGQMDHVIKYIYSWPLTNTGG